jgi:glycosyltransferase involved in cell wall biosynthesis
MQRNDFFVIIPAFNEEKCFEATLERLAEQSDLDFSLVIVNNGSTDGTVELVNRFRRRSDLAVHLIDEPQKGTGAAADTGCRHAIALGARYLARTDADCLPDRDWIANIKRAFDRRGLEFVAGRVKVRADDIHVTRTDRLVLPLLWFIGETVGRTIRRGPRFKYRFIAVAGNNMAVTSELYVRAGGFPRSKIEDVHEDLVLSESIRALTDKAGKCRDVVVHNSIRRVKRYGYWNTVMWYWDHRYRTTDVDIR